MAVDTTQSSSSSRSRDVQRSRAAETKTEGLDRQELARAAEKVSPEQVRTEAARALAGTDDGFERVEATGGAKPGSAATRADAASPAARPDLAPASPAAAGESLGLPAVDTVGPAAPERVIETQAELEAPVRRSEALAEDPAPDFTRVDAWAEGLAARSPDPTYYQGDYFDGVSAALSGEVEGLEDLSPAERTRVLDHAYERAWASGNQAGAHIRTIAGVQGEAREQVLDDMAARAIEYDDRARATAGRGVHPGTAVDRARTLSVEAINASSPAEQAAMLDRLGPEAPEFVAALGLDQPDVRGHSLERSRAFASQLYDSTAQMDSSIYSESVRAEIQARAVGAPTDPAARERWDRLSTLDPTTLGQADLRAASELLSEYPPRPGGSSVLEGVRDRSLRGEALEAAQASQRLAEMRPQIAEDLARENAVYAGAGFDDDRAFTGATPEETRAFIEDARTRVDRLSPRAADQALVALDMERAAGRTVEGEEALRSELERRVVIASGQDLAARLDYQMTTAMGDQGWIGRRWDGARNAVGSETGSEAVGEHVDRLREARDALTSLGDFEGTDAELQAELERRLGNLSSVAQTTSTAIAGYIEQQDSLEARGLGFLQALGGGLEVAGGVALVATPEPTMGTKIIGGVAIAAGVDDIQAGTRSIVSGAHVPTFRHELAADAAEALGASPETAQLVGLGADLAPAALGMARGLYQSTNRWFRAGARAAGEGPTVTRLTDNFAAAAAPLDDAARARPNYVGMSGTPTRTPVGVRQTHLPLIRDGIEGMPATTRAALDRAQETVRMGDQRLEQLGTALNDVSVRIGELHGMNPALRTAEQTAELRSLQRRQESLTSRIDAVDAEQRAARLDARRAMESFMAPRYVRTETEARALAQQVRIDPSAEPHRAAIEEAATQMFRLVEDTSAFRNMRFEVAPPGPNGPRAYALPNGTINVADGNPTTILHEMGHLWEWANPSLHRAATDWRAARATDTQAQLLREMTGSSEYRVGEVALPDHFSDPYIGKVYDAASGTSEVLTTGVQRFLDPGGMVRLYNDDPEQFFLMLGALGR